MPFANSITIFKGLLNLVSFNLPVDSIVFFVLFCFCFCFFCAKVPWYKFSSVLGTISLYCIVLFCIALHCIALHRIALHCIALHCMEIKLI